MSYVPLHVHSQYSILNATASIPSLIKAAKEFDISAMALTDFCNMFGIVEFVKACNKENIKPIIGMEMMLAPDSRLVKKRTPGTPAGYPLTLLAKDNRGYQNLCKLSSLGYLEGFYYTPRIDNELLKKHHEGIICLSGPISGKVGRMLRDKNRDGFDETVEWFQSLFGDDFYFELQNHVMEQNVIEADGMMKESWLLRNYEDYMTSQNEVKRGIVEASEKKGIAIVATGGVHYIQREDWRAHEILMNVQSGEPCEIWEKDQLGRDKARVLNPKRQVLPSHEFYFKSPSQMKELFQDIPEAINTTEEIAEKCNATIDFNARFYPVFVPPSLEGVSYESEQRKVEAQKYLRDLCYEGISERYTEERLSFVKETTPDKDPLVVVKERLEYELEIIGSKGLGDYLLIVRDFIAWAKKENIPVGPGRGSGAGAIICYLIGITDIEPLRFGLFFERFINPERISYPDIDVDICMDRRAEVIDYTINKYGKDKVAQIITFGTMKAKMAIKDVGRVLSVPLAKVNSIAKLVPEDPNMTLDKALEIDPELKQVYETDEEANRVIDLARSLEGSIRNTGIHAAGLIICGEPLTDHIPVCTAKDAEMVATQFSMKPVEAVGMLKIDFLGLKTLTSIQKTAETIEKTQGKLIDWVNLSLDDQITFDLLNLGKTQGVFQLESTGMQELIKQLKIDRFEEIMMVGALYRPGPMEMIPSFINRKHGREPIEVDHPLMKDILAETYGIMVYQEQVMQIASLLAGYSLGEGDVLRRAMGKKDRDEMARQRKKFVDGAREKGVDESTAVTIFDKIEKFASYGFNKSHAAAYGFLSYVTAYFKANYPKEWLSAQMTCDIDDLSKVAKHIRESQTMDIPILPPDVNESGSSFFPVERGIRFAMSGIKGVGKGVVEAIIEEREKSGFFKSLYDFIKRIDTKRVGKKGIETLIEAGSFDFTTWSRAALLKNLDIMYDTAQRLRKEREKGYLDFFTNLEEEEKDPLEIAPEVNPVSKSVQLSREKQLLGFYLTGHPMDEFRDILGKLSCVPFHEIEKLDSGSVIRCAFIIDSLTLRISKTGKKFAILTISDGMERYELPVWPEMYERNSEILEESRLLYAAISLDKSEGPIKLSARWLGDLRVVDEQMIKNCDVAYDKAKSLVKLDQFHKRSKKKNKEKPVIKKCFIQFDIEQMKLSHILELKGIFSDHLGSSPVSIDFTSDTRAIGNIFIDESWGVNLTDELINRLVKLTGYTTHKIDK